MTPIITNAIPKIFVNHSPAREIFWFTAFRAVPSNVLNKITGKACPRPKAKSKSPP